MLPVGREDVARWPAYTNSFFVAVKLFAGPGSGATDFPWSDGRHGRSSFHAFVFGAGQDPAAWKYDSPLIAGLAAMPLAAAVPQLLRLLADYYTVPLPKGWVRRPNHPRFFAKH